MPSRAARNTTRPSPEPKSTNFNNDDDDIDDDVETCFLIKSNMISSLLPKVGRYGAPLRCKTGGKLRMMAR